MDNNYFQNNGTKNTKVNTRRYKSMYTTKEGKRALVATMRHRSPRRIQEKRARKATAAGRIPIVIISVDKRARKATTLSRSHTQKIENDKRARKAITSEKVKGKVIRDFLVYIENVDQRFFLVFIVIIDQEIAAVVVIFIDRKTYYYDMDQEKHEEIWYHARLGSLNDGPEKGTRKSRRLARRRGAHDFVSLVSLVHRQMRLVLQGQFLKRSCFRQQQLSRDSKSQLHTQDFSIDIRGGRRNRDLERRGGVRTQLETYKNINIRMFYKTGDKYTKLERMVRTRERETHVRCRSARKRHSSRAGKNRREILGDGAELGQRLPPRIRKIKYLKNTIKMRGMSQEYLQTRCRGQRTQGAGRDVILLVGLEGREKGGAETGITARRSGSIYEEGEDFITDGGYTSLRSWRAAKARDEGRGSPIFHDDTVLTEKSTNNKWSLRVRGIRWLLTKRSPSFPPRYCQLHLGRFRRHEHRLVDRSSWYDVQERESDGVEPHEVADLTRLNEIQDRLSAAEQGHMCECLQNGPRLRPTASKRASNRRGRRVIRGQVKCRCENRNKRNNSITTEQTRPREKIRNNEGIYKRRKKSLETLLDSSLKASGQGWHHGYAVSEYRLEELRGSRLPVKDMETEETSGDGADNGKDGVCPRTATRSKG